MFIHTTPIKSRAYYIYVYYYTRECVRRLVVVCTAARAYIYILYIYRETYDVLTTRCIYVLYSVLLGKNKQ